MHASRPCFRGAMDHIARTACPDDDLLEGVLAGAVSEEQLEEVTTHLGECCNCLEKLDALHQRTIPLVARLRQTRNGPPLDAVIEQAVLRVKQSVRLEARLAVPTEL